VIVDRQEVHSRRGEFIEPAIAVQSKLPCSHELANRRLSLVRLP
jgi:hypothetical protein